MGIEKNALLEIQARHFSGVYCASEFVEKLQPGASFFMVTCGLCGLGAVLGPYILQNIEEIEGHTSFSGSPFRFLATLDLPNKLPNLPDCLPFHYQFKSGWVSDLFWGPQACFKSGPVAMSYFSELLLLRRKIFTEI
jgi:hypothetical protein